MIISSPAECEQAFYTAFQAGDFSTMQGLLSNDADSTCIHPGQDVLHGPGEIHESWRFILQQQEKLRIHVVNLNTVEDGDLAIHTVEEHLYLDKKLVGVVLATNGYRRTADSWVMFMHHGSSAPREQKTEPPASRETVH